MMKPPVPHPFVIQFKVVESDADAQGHVSNVRVLDWMNQAALEHSAALGFDLARYHQIGGVFVVRRHEIDYLAPSYPGEELVLYTWPSGIRRSLAERRHEIHRPADQRVIARGYNQWVYVDLEGHPRLIPPEVRQAFDPAQFISDE